MIHPFSSSLNTLLQFIEIWHSYIVSAKTSREIARISMPLSKFKLMYGVNPQKAEYPVPKGAERFMAGVVVVDIIVP